MARGGFHKRTMSLGGFLLRVGWLLLFSGRLLRAHLSKGSFRPEVNAALWLAVTEVNGCRWCTYVHEGMAGASGLGEADIALLLASSAPEDLEILVPGEAPYIAYAKVWAESEGRPPVPPPEPDAAVRAPAPAGFEAFLRFIDFANRCGNTLDSLLDRFRHPRRLLQPWSLVNDLVVGTLVAVFGWPALVAGAFLRWRVRRRRASNPG